VHRTENVLLLVGLGAAAELAFSERAAQAAHMRAMRDRLAAGLLAAFPPELVRINGPADARLALPNTLSISIKGLAAASLLQMLHAQLAASAGAACHSSKGPAVSPVLHAMSLGPAWAVGTLRLSTGRHTTADEVDRAVQLIRDAAVRQGIIGEQQQQQPPQQPQQAGEGNGRIEGSVAQAAPAR
jgi:cysteine desulfurase